MEVRFWPGAKSMGLKSDTPGFEFGVWHFLVVRHGVREVSNVSDICLLHLQNGEISTYQWRLLGNCCIHKYFMYTTCLAHNKHQV